MIERFFYTALQASFGLFRTRPSLFEQLFGQLYGLSEREVTAIRSAMVAKFPKLYHAFDPTAATMPCYVLAIGPDSQTQSMLTNTAGMMTPMGGGAPRPLFSTIWRHQYTLMCYAENKDFSLYMYEIAKCALYLQVEYLLKNNIYELSLSGDGVAPDEREPERLFVRNLGISCSREFRFFDDGSEPRLFKVDGLYVADGRDAENGGVDARITVEDPNPTRSP